MAKEKKEERKREIIPLLAHRMAQEDADYYMKTTFPLQCS